MRKALPLAYALILVFLPLSSIGQTVPASPAIVSYQGRISDSSLNVLPDGFYEFAFLIFDAQTSGNLLWSETQPAVELTGSIYHVGLGSVVPLEFSTFKAKDAWLEVRIFGETFSGRRRIVSVPFALKAEGEVPPGAIILSQTSADPAFTPFGYSQQGSTVGPYYLYQKDAYNPAANRVPQVISYQARIKPIGATLGPSADLGFSIYTAAEGGSAVWSELQPGAAIPGGMIDADLGAFTPLLPTYLTSKDLWLEVSVNSQTLSPREKLEAAPYALKVESPVPPGGIVLSSTAANSDLVSKKFTAIGTALSGYYPFRKDVFSASSPSLPLLIGYQGRINKSATGLPLTGPADLGFYIYSSALAGTVLWSETVTGVTFDSGIFNVLLGSGSTITPDTFTGPQAYLEVHVKVGTTTEVLSPRERITSVPLAMQAEGTMPNGAMLLATTSNNSELLNSGFSYSGGMIGGYYVYGKFDLDITSPQVEIVEPAISSGFASPSVFSQIDFSDDLSGVDTSSIEIYLNNTLVTTDFIVSSAGASGNVTAQLGENLLKVILSDLAGNVSQKIVSFYMDNTGIPPAVMFSSPLDGSTSSVHTPFVQIQLQDIEGGLDLDSLEILVNGVDRTSNFTMTNSGASQIASWQVPSSLALSNGTNQIYAYIKNLVGLGDGTTVTFSLLGTEPSITFSSITPPTGFPGEVVRLNGSGFSDVISQNKVIFSDNQQAEIISASATQLFVNVPEKAINGLVSVTVNNHAADKPRAFAIGPRYGFVANYNSAWVADGGANGKVSVIDYDSVTPGTWLNRIPCGTKPFDVEVSPDGRWLYVSDNTGNKVYFIRTATASSSSDNAGSVTIPGPRYMKVSPDGLKLFVGTESGKLYILTNHALRDDGIKTISSRQLNNMDISSLYQYLYLTVNPNNSTVRGSLEFIDIDPSQESYLSSIFSELLYYKPVGVAVYPDQSAVFATNNYSNATSRGINQFYSYYQFPTIGGSGGVFGANIVPTTDSHDVNWAFEIIFHPLGRMFYSSFAEGYADDDVNSTSNNVGAQIIPSLDSDFDAATNTQFPTPSRSPKGLAFSPDGKWLFAANFGLSTGEGDKIMALNNALVQNAILSDAGNGSYNLTGTNPESLENASIPGNPNIVKFANGFDGPRNIAFQQFPLIDLYPRVIHLALGGSAPATVRTRVNPIYGDSIRTWTLTGSSILMEGSSINSSFHIRNMAPDREICQFDPSGPSAGSWRMIVAGSTVGFSEVIADVQGYASNVAFVTVPPQNFIQVLIGEPCATANETTFKALASVVRNRLRLTKDCFNHPNLPGGCVQFSFPNPLQVTAANATESFVTQQIRLSFTSGYNSVGTIPYKNAATRTGMPANEMANYDTSVNVAGDIMLDTLRTLKNDRLLWKFTLPEPNSSDIVDDPTGGSFFFYSPTDTQWTGINAALAGSTIFPDNGGLETSIVCGSQTDKGMAFYFCTPDANNIRRARLLQIVLVHGIPNNDCVGGKHTAPQFIFIRWRNFGDPAVVWGN